MQVKPGNEASLGHPSGVAHYVFTLLINIAVNLHM